jgi:uncharacterized protein
MNKAIGLLIATFLVLTGCSASAQKVPALNGRVVDDANLLDLEIETLLNGELEETERQYGHQFVVVTVQSLQGKSIDEYGLTLGNAWGIGDKKRNDGLILLIAPNERRVRIEVGYGLESSFSDDVCQAILDETILPEFREGKMQKGIVDGVQRILARLKTLQSRPSNDNEVVVDAEEAA